MQEKSKKSLLKILKGYKNLQEPVLKTDKNNLNNFRSDSELSKNLFKNFENALKEEIESKDFNKNFNEDQLKTEQT